MSGQAETFRIFAPVIMLANLASCSPGSAFAPTKNETETMSSLSRANDMAIAVQPLRKLTPTPFGANNQVAFGTLMFRYLPDHEQLVAAIMVEDFDLWDKLGVESATKYRLSQAALSDPAIGGRFDSGGGAWLFEEASGKTYLFAAFPLDTPPAEVNTRIERMARVVPAWTTRWSAEVAQIAHGKRPPPSRPVTLDDDPYAGQL